MLRRIMTQANTVKSKGTVDSPPIARNFGNVNWMGLVTLYKKEVRRFMKVFPQTLLAPIISNLLFMTVFVLAFTEQRGSGSPEFIKFLAPGLVMLGILNNLSLIHISEPTRPY